MTTRPASAERIALPPPDRSGGPALSAIIASRRSVRIFMPRELTPAELSQLLWAAQGITDKREGFRASPSAGALYPLEAYAVLPAGIYHYRPEGHVLERVRAGDARHELASAAFGQDAVGSAAGVFVLTSVDARTMTKYGQRGIRYVHMEAGHAAQNVLLTAEALGLGAVPVGAFNDDRVARVLGLGEKERPLYLIPVGG